jgi:hypothetical protein
MSFKASFHRHSREQTQSVPTGQTELVRRELNRRVRPTCLAHKPGVGISDPTPSILNDSNGFDVKRTPGHGRTNAGHVRQEDPEPRRSRALSRPRFDTYMTASLRSLDARKAIFLLALILMASLVAGLRPIRAARLRI